MIIRCHQCRAIFNSDLRVLSCPHKTRTGVRAWLRRVFKII